MGVEGRKKTRAIGNLLTTPRPAAARVNGRAIAKAETQTALEERFRQAQSKLSGSRQQLLKKILAEANETFFLSSREMGRRYNVDSATIVRTVQATGYERFADFVHDLRNHFVTRITPYTSLKAATQKKRSVSDFIQLSVDKDLENLSSLKAGLDLPVIVDLATRISGTRRVVIIGIDFAASLANLLAYGLVRLGRDAEAPVGSIGSIQNRLNIMTGKDLLIAISFGKCLRDTVNAARLAKRRGVTTFGITDSEHTPIAKVCDQHLIASIDRTSFIDSYVAPVAAINAILIACAHSQPTRSLKMLEQFEKELASGNRWYNETSDSKS